MFFLLLLLFECVYFCPRETNGRKGEWKCFTGYWGLTCKNVLVSEHNLNYLELQLFFGSQEMWSYTISLHLVCMQVFFSRHHERLEVVCFWNAPNHIWVLVLHYLWSFSLSVASVWHLIAFSTLPLPLKEENSLCMPTNPAKAEMDQSFRATAPMNLSK